MKLVELGDLNECRGLRRGNSMAYITIPTNETVNSKVGTA